MAKIIPSIYAIDSTKVRELLSEGARYEASNAHGYIAQKHMNVIEQTGSQAKPFRLISQQTIGAYKVAIYSTVSNSHLHKWSDLFPEPLNNITVQYPNLAAFFSKGSECFAISSGMGHTLFEQFIDVGFPLEVAQRIMGPRLNATTERDITGSVYGRAQQFRTSQRIISSQSLGTVWQAIKGEIIDEIKNSAEFISIFEPDSSRIGVDAGSSLTIRRSIDIAHCEALLDWLTVVRTAELSSTQKEAFRFLQGLKQVSPRNNSALVADLKIALSADLLNLLNTSSVIDLDFSHRFFASYQEARLYKVESSACDTPWHTPPACDEVFQVLRDAELLDTTNAAALLKCLELLRFTAENENAIDSTHGSVFSHLHGEVKHGSDTYFLIDGKFYYAQGAFLSRVQNDFVNLIGGPKFVNDLGLNLDDFVTAAQLEGPYNESYIGKHGWIVGDRCLMDNVELADLVYWNNNKLFIIHNKIGFGASVRDVCSQVLLSMQILDQAINANDTTMIGEYYERVKGRYYADQQISITKQDFINKVIQTDKNKIVYVVGYALTSPVTGSSRSSIAKFEMLKLCEVDTRPYDFGLRVLHIQRG